MAKDYLTKEESVRTQCLIKQVNEIVDDSLGTAELELTESEKRLIELLRYFEKDRSLQHLSSIWIRRLQIMKSRDITYNKTKDAYANTFGEGDAEAFINCKRNWERISDTIHNGNNHLECYVSRDKFEAQELLQDHGNYTDLWECGRWERMVSGSK